MARNGHKLTNSIYTSIQYRATSEPQPPQPNPLKVTMRFSIRPILVALIGCAMAAPGIHARAYGYGEECTPVTITDECTAATFTDVFTVTEPTTVTLSATPSTTTIFSTVTETESADLETFFLTEFLTETQTETQTETLTETSTTTDVVTESVTSTEI